MFSNSTISTPPTGHKLKPGAKILILIVVGLALFFGFLLNWNPSWDP